MQLGPSDRKAIEALFAAIERPVEVCLELGPSESGVTLLAGGGRELDPSERTYALVEDLCALSPLVTLEVVERAERGPFPRTTIAGRLVFVGTPWGYELTSLAHGIAAAGRDDPGLTAASLATLARIDRDVEVEVYVTPSCANCPPAVLLAYRCALAQPHLRATAVESSEFPERTSHAGVTGVPAVAVDGRPVWAGRVPEDVFVTRLVGAAGAAVT